jgi:ABC-2 type transport system permease protein
MSNLNRIERKMNYAAVWILARRELYEFFRSKTRIITSLAQGLLFLLIFSAGFAKIGISINGVAIDSKAFTASGIAAIMILFTAIFGGMGLMRDKMFGFLKELIVAPVNRRTLMFGKTLGIALQTLIQVGIILSLSAAMGFFGYDISLIWRMLLIIPVAFLASLGIVGMGLTISIRLRDFQSFGLVQTFIVMPMFWFSGALFAFNNVPYYMQIIIMCNPFSYSVDLFRAVLLGVSYFPILLDLTVIIIFGILFILIGARSFNRMEV